MTSLRSEAVLRGDAAAQATPYQQDTLTGVTPVGAAPTEASARVRLDDVYAEEIARLHAQAHTEGYEAGFAEGMTAAQAVVAEAEAQARARLAEVHADFEEQMAATATALAAAVARLDAAMVPVGDDLAATITEAAFALLGDLLGRELAVAADPGQDAVRRALALCPTDAPVLVRLHPHDHARLSEEWLAQLPATVTVRADPAVEPSGALAEAGARRVDAQIGSALARVRAVLQP